MISAIHKLTDCPHIFTDFIVHQNKTEAALAWHVWVLPNINKLPCSLGKILNLKTFLVVLTMENKQVRMGLLKLQQKRMGSQTPFSCYHPVPKDRRDNGSTRNGSCFWRPCPSLLSSSWAGVTANHSRAIPRCLSPLNTVVPNPTCLSISRPPVCSIRFLLGYCLRDGTPSNFPAEPPMWPSSFSRDLLSYNFNISLATTGTKAPTQWLYQSHLLTSHKSMWVCESRIHIFSFTGLKLRQFLCHSIRILLKELCTNYW